MCRGRQIAPENQAGKDQTNISARASSDPYAKVVHGPGRRSVQLCPGSHPRTSAKMAPEEQASFGLAGRRRGPGEPKFG
jgi:hypothetical protein